MSVLTLPTTDVSPVRAKAFVFADAQSRALLERIELVAPSDATVLVSGETGTGKEIVARHLHELSRRRDRPWVAVNCGALTESLADSELFGHERGAFTGAESAKAGWFEAANGGTLFLDEVGDLSAAVQVKLLRVLQEGEVVRLGSRKPLPVSVRLIAATNVPLEQAVVAGRFRTDLYYRLNVVSLSLPPLRERRDDIMPLALHFLERYGRRLGLGQVTLSPEAQLALRNHGWPGNIRELENVIHHGLLICRDGCVEPSDLRLTVLATAAASGGALHDKPSLEGALIELFEQDRLNLHQWIEEQVIRSAYRYSDGNQLQTARLLGISRNIVRARLIQCGEISGSVRRPLPARGATSITRAAALDLESDLDA